MDAAGSTATTRALVLGGGGVAGIAWEIGMLLGLADSGVDVTRADLVVGTSAGATVAAQLAVAPLEALFERQTATGGPAGELPATFTAGRMAELLTAAATAGASPDERRAAVGRVALEADTVPEPVRRAVIAQRLPSDAWPDHALRIVAVDATSGEPRVFEGPDDAGLVDAVAASCAVPGVWPPVTIGSRRYIDGAVRSATNADLAAGHDAVLVLAPMADDPALLPEDVAAGMAALESGARVLVLAPDAASAAAMGENLLDPATRGPAAEAGRAQGRAVSADVRRFWH